MTSHELFGRLAPADTAGVLEWLQDNDRPAYKTCAGLLATRRKLRPVFVERKPKAERNAWMVENLAKPANGDLAAELLQSWLLGSHVGMVCDFLDLLKIPHDGKGLIESLPPEPDAAAVDQAVDALFAKHPPGAVVAYLHIFSSMEMTEWPHLHQLVLNDPRLCLNPTNP